MHFMTMEEGQGYKKKKIPMVNISIILPMHFEAMSLYKVPAGKSNARVALMKFTFIVQVRSNPICIPIWHKV